MKPRRWHRFMHYRKQKLLMWLLAALVGMEFLENGMFVFGSSHILGGIGAAPQEFAQVQAAYAILAAICRLKTSSLAMNASMP